MSYSRWSEDCDVYCYQSDAGYEILNRAQPSPEGNYLLPTYKAMVKKLKELDKQGYKIPGYLIGKPYKSPFEKANEQYLELKKARLAARATLEAERSSRQ